jgi:hypothetical protein
MNDRFNYTASTLSTEELQDRIDNREKYLPETIEASVTELQNRGHVFTGEELQVIKEDLQAQHDNAGLQGSGGISGTYKNTIVEDPAAPLFYSRRAVFLFAVFMGALFGSIMFAINLAKIKKYAEVVWVLLFGVGFTILQYILISYANTGNSLGIFFGLISGYSLDYFFWERFIGRSVFYRARPVWVPLIIAILLGALIVWGMFYNKSQ